MQENNVFYQRVGRFTSQPKAKKEEFEKFEFNNNLKSNKIEELEFTNYLSSNKCNKYFVLLEVCKNLYNNCYINKYFVVDNFNWTKLNAKRVQDIINTINCEQIKENTVIYKLKNKEDQEIQFYVTKENNTLKLQLIDIYHIAIEAINVRTGKADRKGIYKARKNSSFDIKEIQKQLNTETDKR